MRKSPLLKLLLLTLLITIVWYVWTPRRAWDRFLTGVVMANPAMMQEYADFPTLRTNLKTDLKKSMQASDSQGILGGLATGLLDQMVAMTLTPRGIAEVVTGFGTRSPNTANIDSLETGTITSFSYRSPSRVDVQIRPNGADKDKSGVFTLKRSGFKWRVTRIWSKKLEKTGK